MNTLAPKINELSPKAKTFAVITGALLTGCLWRVRGDNGFGGMWGMLVVAAGLTMLIFSLFGKREKINYEILPVAVLSMAITAAGWGTLNSQMAGFLESGANFTGEEVARSVEINPLSGLFIMLCLGFGWMPLFAMLLGSLFSQKRYSIGHYLLLLGVYFASFTLYKLTVSHLLVGLASPKAVELFNFGLIDRGINLSPYKAYLTNFFSLSAAKKIPGGRNYFACVSAVSATLAAGTAMAVQRFALKDKLASLIAMGVNSVCAVAITAADIFLVIGYKGNLFHIYTVPAWIEACSWSLWEFFTGFLIGFGIMLIVVLLPSGVITGNAKASNSFHLRRSGPIFVYNSVFTLFGALCLPLVLAVGTRLSEKLAQIHSLPGFVHTLTSQTAVTFAAGLVMLIICTYEAYKNVIRRQLKVPAPMGIERFCQKRLPVFFAACSIIYFFTGDSYLLNVKLVKLTPHALLTALMEGLDSVNIIMLMSVTLFFASYSALMHFVHKEIKKK